MVAVYVKDLYNNYYIIVQPSDYFMLENSEKDKNDYFAYIDSNNNFISCNAHKDKYPQATFIVGDYNKILRARDPSKK